MAKTGYTDVEMGVNNPTGVGAPPAQTMMDSYVTGDGLIMSQHTSECCRFMCCQPNIDWTLHNYTENLAKGPITVPVKMFIKEDAPYCGRVFSFWAPGCRPTTYTQTEMATNAVVMTHRKEMSCGQNSIVACSNDGPIRCPMCCCLPYLDTHDSNGVKVGSSHYIQDCCLCVPKLVMKDANGAVKYAVRPDVCCAGCCIKCSCKGKGARCFQIPFFIRDPMTLEKLQATRGATAVPAQIACGSCGTTLTVGPNTMPGAIVACPQCQANVTVPGVATATSGDDAENWAQISDLWAGLGRELCTRRNLYGVKWPADADTNTRATLIGMALLIDVALMEQDS